MMALARRKVSRGTELPMIRFSPSTDWIVAKVWSEYLQHCERAVKHVVERVWNPIEGRDFYPALSLLFATAVLIGIFLIDPKQPLRTGPGHAIEPRRPIWPRLSSLRHIHERLRRNGLYSAATMISSTKGLKR
jgi:hypothetical protein